MAVSQLIPACTRHDQAPLERLKYSKRAHAIRARPLSIPSLFAALNWSFRCKRKPSYVIF